jgi:hypothetical protein
MGEKRLVDESDAALFPGGLAGSFVEFAVSVEPRLRRALMPTLGVDAATDATAEALAYGWEHWERVRSMSNPAG